MLIVREAEGRLPGIAGGGPDEPGGLLLSTEQRLKLTDLERELLTYLTEHFPILRV